MTTPLGLIVASLALLTALAAAWFVVPRPPVLDGEVWFKSVLARRLRGRGVDPGTIGRLVPYHPLGRLAERKLSHPGIEAVPGAPLPGETALVAELAALPDVRARWSHLYRDSLAQLDGVTAGLSTDHGFRRWLGPGFDADADLTAVAERAEARLDATWVALVSGPGDAVGAVEGALAAFAHPVVWPTCLEAPSLLQAHGRFLADLAQVERATPTTWALTQTWAQLFGAAALRTLVAGVAEALTARLPEDQPSARLIVVATDVGVPLLLRVLADHVAVRDRVAAVVSVGGAVLGDPQAVGPLSEAGCRDWMEHHFRHERMDIEVVRLVPYVSVQWLDGVTDPPGAHGLPMALARFPTPGFVGAESEAIEPVDLGPLSADPALPAQDVVAALRAVVDLFTLSRR